MLIPCIVTDVCVSSFKPLYTHPWKIHQMQDGSKPPLVFVDLWWLNKRTIQNRVEELRWKLTTSTTRKKKWPRRTFKAFAVMFQYESLKLSVVSSGCASELVRYAEAFFPWQETSMVNDLMRIQVDPLRRNIPRNERRLSPFLLSQRKKHVTTLRCCTTVVPAVHD